MDLIYTQLAFRPPKPTADFTGKTVIVTGANVGLGKEAVKNFVRLNAAKVIATARSLERGKAAVAEIESETGRAGVAELWALDYGSYASVKQFCAKVAELERVDAVVLNAGLGTPKFEIFEGDESTITVNVISTVLLMLLLLPTLRASATKWGIVPTLSVTGSAYHKSAKFPERDAANSLDVLSDPKTANMAERYVCPSSSFSSAVAHSEQVSSFQTVANNGCSRYCSPNCREETFRPCQLSQSRTLLDRSHSKRGRPERFYYAHNYEIAGLDARRGQ
jgi:NAD(P)-dependent dehydrogenase (short-subunit alcohol dehydrogenase family)